MASKIQHIIQTGVNFELLPAERMVYSRVIEMAAMPLLRFDQFAMKKTELVNEPGLSIRMSYWADLPEYLTNTGAPNTLSAERRLIEGTQIETETLSMQSIDMFVGEYGRAVAASRLTTRTAYVNWIRDSLPILARDYAKAVDSELRNYIFGMRANGSGTNLDADLGDIMYDWDARPGIPLAGTLVDSISCAREVYGEATTPLGNVLATSRAQLVGDPTTPATYFNMTARALMQATEILALNNVPKLPGGYWGCILHPHQIAEMKLDDRFARAVIDGSRAASDIYSGVLGVYDGVVFFESSRTPVIAGGSVEAGETGFNTLDAAGAAYGAVVFGNDAWGRAIGCPVELVTDGVHDFGREIRIGWYSIWGQKYIAPFNLDRACIVWTN